MLLDFRKLIVHPITHSIVKHNLMYMDIDGDRQCPSIYFLHLGLLLQKLIFHHVTPQKPISIIQYFVQSIYEMYNFTDADIILQIINTKIQ